LFFVTTQDFVKKHERTKDEKSLAKMVQTVLNK